MPVSGLGVARADLEHRADVRPRVGLPGFGVKREVCNGQKKYTSPYPHSLWVLRSLLPSPSYSLQKSGSSRVRASEIAVQCDGRWAAIAMDAKPAACSCRPGDFRARARARARVYSRTTGDGRRDHRGVLATNEGVKDQKRQRQEGRLLAGGGKHGQRAAGRARARGTLTQTVIRRQRICT